VVLTLTSLRGRRTWVQPFGEHQRVDAKYSFTTRRVPRDAMQTVLGGSVRPRSGDLVYARVSRLGHHKKIEQPDGRRAQLHLDDTIVVTYGDRYAADQFEAQVPADLGPTQLVASGGIASQMLSRSMGVRNATDIVPLGLVGDERGRPLNLAQFALPPVTPTVPRPRTVAVIGTSMNSGKTTTIHYLAHGLSRANGRPGVTKVTGTGSGGDYWVMIDAGAHLMLDFSDAGMSSTYRQPLPVIESALVGLVNQLTAAGAGINLVEIADGIYQQETARLIESDTFRDTIDLVLFAAGDAMGAVAGVTHLRSIGLDVAAISGRITRSPLGSREAAAATGLPVVKTFELADAALASSLLRLDPGLLTLPEAAETAAPAGAVYPSSTDDLTLLLDDAALGVDLDERQGQFERADAK
jgi:hypothetical protein